jgi:hypothetical protein
MPSPTIDRSTSGYTPLQNTGTSQPSPNVIDIKGRKLEDLVNSFNTATGNPDAELRAIHGQQGMRVVVPSSHGSVPTLWIRFKAALSTAFGGLGTVRAARAESDSRQLNGGDLASQIVSAIRTEESDGDHSASRAASTQLKALRLTGGLTKRNVHLVLQSATTTLAARSARTTLAEMRQNMKEEARQHAGMANRDPVSGTRVASPRNPTSRHKALFNLCAKTVRESLPNSDSHKIEKDSTRLYDNVKSFLQSKHRWPPADVEEIADVVQVSYTNMTYS